RIQHVHFHTCSYSHTSAPQIYTPSLHDALPIYPARELVGIGPVDALRIADLYCGKHLEHLRPERAATPADPVDSQGFGDLIPDAHDGVEGKARVLHHHGDALPAQIAHGPG